MIERQIHLSSGGGAALQGYDGLLRFGYTRNRGILTLRGLLAPAGWERCPLHAGGGRPCGGARPHHGCARGGAHHL